MEPVFIVIGLAAVVIACVLLLRRKGQERTRSGGSRGGAPDSQER